MPIEAGMQVGPYEILAPIGQGGMGAVFRARDGRLGREVAVKVLHAELGQDPTRLRRFEQEARVLAALNHPNLVQIFDVGEAEGSPYLVMELLEGTTLRERMGPSPMPVKKVLELLVPVLEGLAAAHQAGIIHRDLKPENLFITKDGRVKILDFGLAKLRRQTGAQNQSRTQPLAPETEATAEGTILGTAGYMSPEQVESGPLDARSDLFSFGVILWELLTGIHPFRGDTVLDTLHAIRRGEVPEFPEGLVLPEALDHLLRRCLEKMPEHRFQTAQDLLFALQHLPGSSSHTRPQPTRPGPTFRRWLVPALSALLFLLSLTLGWTWFHRPRQALAQDLMDQTYVIHSARFMSDGKTVVFSASKDGQNEELYLLHPGRRQPERLHIKGAQVCDVSPSGELALILRKDPSMGFGDLALLPASGGAPRKVAENVGWAQFGPDGKDLVIKWFRYKGEARQVITYRDREVLEIPYGQAIGGFSLSPGRDALAAVVSKPAGRFVTVCGLDGRRRIQRRVEGFHSDSETLWTHEGILGSTKAPGQGPHLMSFDPRTLEAKPVLGLTGSLTLLDKYGTGDLLYVPADAEGRQTVIRWKKHDTEQEISLEWKNSRIPLLSGNGRCMVSWDRVDGAWLASTDLQDPIQLSRSGSNSLPLSISRDGSQVLLRRSAQDTEDYYELAVVPVGPGTERVLPGRWLANWAFGSADLKRVLLIWAWKLGEKNEASYLIDTSGGEPRRLPVGTQGPLSPDGTRAFHRAPDLKGKLHVFNLETGQPEGQALPLDMEPLRWRADGLGIWMVKQKTNEEYAASGWEVWSYALSTDSATQAFQIPGPGFPVDLLGPLSLSEDGQSYAYGYRRSFPVKTKLYRLTFK